MNINEIEKTIIKKERCQMQIEEMRSIFDTQINPTFQVKLDSIEKSNVFESPSEIKYLSYLRKPQIVQENNYMCVKKNCLILEKPDKQQQSFNLKNLSYLQIMKKNRIHLVFQDYGSVYIQFQTQRKSLKFYEALNYCFETKCGV